MDLATTTNRLLPGIEHRPTELGRIRLGDKSVTDKGKEYPVKLETWRLTSGNRAALQVAADIYGGTVEAWTDGPNEGFYELLTDSSTLSVLIPRDLRTLSQWYEWWQGGTCERRCDGTTEQNSQSPCPCKAEGTMECRPRTRLNIMLPDIPGLGVWRLETDGWNAATSLPATIEMLLALSVQPWVKAVLRLEQRSAKKRQPDGKVVTHRFAVPVLDTPDDLTLGRIVGQRMRQEQPEQLPETVAPVTAAERVAAKRAEIEAQTTSGSGGDPSSVPAAAVGPDDAGAPADISAAPSSSTAGDEAIREGEAPGSVGDGGAEPASDEAVGHPAESEGEAEGEADRQSQPASPDMPPPPQSAGQACGAWHAEYGPCQRMPDHAGNHQGMSKESWK